jgi:hypothetical protein
MKSIIEFNLPEENDDFQMATNTKAQFGILTNCLGRK